MADSLSIWYWKRYFVSCPMYTLKKYVWLYHMSHVDRVLKLFKRYFQKQRIDDKSNARRRLSAIFHYQWGQEGSQYFKVIMIVTKYNWLPSLRCVDGSGALDETELGHCLKKWMSVLTTWRWADPVRPTKVTPMEQLTLMNSYLTLFYFILFNDVQMMHLQRRVIDFRLSTSIARI
jgi:hypothetical protein